MSIQHVYTLLYVYSTCVHTVVCIFTSVSSLVPDLAPEKLILQHGLSSSYENLTIHSVSSSPDVTLLSVRSYRHPVGGVGAAAAPFPDVTLHSHSSSDESSSPGMCYVIV